MKKVLVGAMALLALAACSNEEVLDQNQVRNEIGFTAVTGKALSRANDGYCNNSLPATFHVSASYKAAGGTAYKQYFLNDGYKQEGGTGTTYVSSGSVRYWPSFEGGATMKFFATTSTTPGTPDPKPIPAPTWTDDTYAEMQLKDYEVGTTVADQHDLLYAVQDVTSKPADGKQSINFRHALSQIEFKAKNENSNIHVEICGVSVVNVNNKGTFKFSKSTSTNIPEHDYSGTYPSEVGAWSAWADKSTYAVNFGPFEITSGGTDLTTQNESGKEYSANTMYLIPQTITKWDKSTTPKAEDESDKTYFLVKAKIWNIAGAAFDSGTDVILWGKGSSMDATDAKNIAIPATDVTWQPGKRYVYTFVFTTDGTGGYDPSTGDDVLVPIKLDVKVDDFVNAADEIVNMTK